MVKPITAYVTQKRLSWYGHEMRIEDTNVAKQVTTIKVGGKRSRGWPRLRWMDRVRSDMGGKRPRGRPRLRWMDRVWSDMKENQLDPKLAQNREAWRKAVMAIDPGQG